MTERHTQPRATSSWTAACPECRQELGPLTGDELVCAGCRATWRRVEGVWNCVVAQRRSAVEQFLDDYTRIRHAEGRGSDDPAYYRSLPDPTDGDPLAWQWRIRTRSWRHLERTVIERLEPGSHVVDLGAGVGWLSHRLALAGHRPVAIDLSTDPFDGLGAARHYDGSWPCVQAEFDRIPLASGQADLAIFNASFHYCVDPLVTLREAVRILHPGGTVVVLDTPVYRDDAAGEQMAAERHADFETRFGTRSDTVPSIEFLTDRRLRALGDELGIEWQTSQAWYGWRWWWRPYRSRLRRRREPSRFILIVGSVR